MAGKSEFQDILNGFLEGKHASSERTAPAAPRSEGLDPAHLAFLLGTVRVTRSARPTTRTFARAERKPSARPVRVSGPAHVLDEAQQNSLAWFLENGELLERDFTETELKKAYRRLALRFHPDRPGGTAQRFRALRGHESALRRLFAAG